MVATILPGADPDFIHDIYKVNNVDLHFFYKTMWKIKDKLKNYNQPQTKC
jgi:hypothetical protein